MHLRPLTNGKITGTGTLTGTTLKGCNAVKVVVSTDGTNAAAVVLRQNDASGDILFDISTKQPGEFPTQPILIEAGALYYSISGTGASAQLFGYVA